MLKLTNNCALPGSIYLSTSGSVFISVQAYALALARKGYPDHIIRSLIIEQRTSWQNHLGEIRKIAYINRTIAKARSIINQV